MHRALCSIEEAQARLRGISRNSLSILRAGSLLYCIEERCGVGMGVMAG